MAWWATCSRSCPSWLAACDAARVTSCAPRPGAFTGHCNNRRGFEVRVRSLRSREDVSVALIVCDVDNFKRINDLHGHQSGGKVLASGRMQSSAPGRFRPEAVNGVETTGQPFCRPIPTGSRLNRISAHMSQTDSSQDVETLKS
ncbi:diguanylate cyclase domain-containing protein [Achromobacter aegrifaciens]